jgi:hypothetical protein
VVVGFIDTEGCKVERGQGRDPILVITKHTSNSTSTTAASSSLWGMFGGESDNSLSFTLKADTEQDLQDWLRPLKLAAGVAPFRGQPPVTYINCDLRAQWVKKLSKFGKSPLHILAQLNAVTPREFLNTDASAYGEQTLMMASWLIETGCDLLWRDNEGRTALQVAMDCSNVGMINFLHARQAALDLPDTYTLLPPPVRSKGFSYLQIHFRSMLLVGDK